MESAGLRPHHSIRNPSCGNCEKLQGIILNQTEFYEANAVDGELSDAQMMHMLNLPEGDSAQAQVSEPAAEAPPEPATPVEVKAVEEAKPVILAKDGVHTIEYEKLVEAREEAKYWKQVALDAQAKPEPTKPAEQVPAETLEVDDEELFGDFSPTDFKKGVKTLLASERDAIKQELRAELEKELAPLKEQRALTAEQAHYAAIEAAHPDVNAIAQSAELAAWIDKQPSFARDRYQDVIAQGTAEQVIEALNTFKAATGKLATAPVKTNVEAAAQAAIAKAQSKPPMSLSEIPAGSNVATDEVASMMEMTSAGLMNKFEGKSPEQIMALLNRVL